MRPVGEGLEHEEKDLKHLQRILKRARLNDIGRSMERRTKYIGHCQGMIDLLTEDIDTEWAKAPARPKSAAKKKKAA